MLIDNKIEAVLILKRKLGIILDILNMSLYTKTVSKEKKNAIWGILHLPVYIFH